MTFEICLLTYFVYIGSAVCSAGTETVVIDFSVLSSESHPRFDPLRRWLRTWPHDLGTHERDPPDRTYPIYIGTLAVFVIFQVPTALAVNFAMLLCFRFLTGFIGSSVLATGGASIGDIFAPKKRAYAIGIWGVAAACGPVLGPLVGGFAARMKAGVGRFGS